MIEGLNDKFEDFLEKLECFDTEVFIILPMIMLLRWIINEDYNLCENFLPELNNDKEQICRWFLECK